MTDEANLLGKGGRFSRRQTPPSTPPRSAGRMFLDDDGLLVFSRTVGGLTFTAMRLAEALCSVTVAEGASGTGELKLEFTMGSEIVLPRPTPTETLLCSDVLAVNARAGM